MGYSPWGRKESDMTELADIAKQQQQQQQKESMTHTLGKKSRQEKLPVRVNECHILQRFQSSYYKYVQ